MKIIISLLFILCAPNILFAQQYYQVTIAVLNVRDTASKNGAIVGKVYQGDSIYVLNYSSNWSNVKLKDGTVGYVASKYISTDFQQYKNNNKEENNEEKSSDKSWGSIVGLTAIILLCAFLGGRKAISSTSGSDETKNWMCDHCNSHVRQKRRPTAIGCAINPPFHRWREM